MLKELAKVLGKFKYFGASRFQNNLLKNPSIVFGIFSNPAAANTFNLQIMLIMKYFTLTHIEERNEMIR